MRPPVFTPFPSALDPLGAPAVLHYPFNHFDYAAPYDAATGFTLANVPVGSSFVMVSDVADGNGIVNSILPVVVGDVLDFGRVWVTTRKSIEDIYVPLGLAIDPTRAQVVMSIHTSPTDGDAPVRDAECVPPAAVDAVLYDTAGGGYAKGTATGPAGMAILVNLESPEYPGTTHPVRYRVGGVEKVELSFPVAAGATTRVYFNQASALP
jgi:hypothetical protein